MKRTVQQNKNLILYQASLQPERSYKMNFDTHRGKMKLTESQFKAQIKKLLSLRAIIKRLKHFLMHC